MDVKYVKCLVDNNCMRCVKVNGSVGCLYKVHECGHGDHGHYVPESSKFVPVDAAKDQTDGSLKPSEYAAAVHRDHFPVGMIFEDELLINPCKEIELTRGAVPKSALDTQVGGDHYKNMKIQPTEYCQKNRLNACESNIVKYASRHQAKNGAEDIKKIIHYAQLILAMEYPEVDNG